MITNEEQLEQARDCISQMERILESLRDRMLPQSRQWYKLMVEGPEEEIKRLRADVDDYLARKERAKIEAQSRKRKRV